MKILLISIFIPQSFPKTLTNKVNDFFPFSFLPFPSKSSLIFPSHSQTKPERRGKDNCHRKKNPTISIIVWRNNKKINRLLLSFLTYDVPACLSID